MAHLGATMERVEAGRVEIALAFRPELSQQHGFFHAGIISTIADSAGGYAAFTLFPADSGVLTIEFKINLTAPADGERAVAVGEVIPAGARSPSAASTRMWTRRDSARIAPPASPRS